MSKTPAQRRIYDKTALTVVLITNKSAQQAVIEYTGYDELVALFEKEFWELYHEYHEINYPAAPTVGALGELTGY